MFQSRPSAPFPFFLPGSPVGKPVSGAAGLSEEPAHVDSERQAAARTDCLGAVLVPEQSGEVGSELDRKAGKGRLFPQQCQVCESKQNKSDLRSGGTW